MFNSTTTLMIRIGIPLKPYIFSAKMLFKKNEDEQKGWRSLSILNQVWIKIWF